ncbi:MAG: hypothetical protein RMY34_00505 [Aulosira sp. DedQUE10]|nr:hypothetical protein [Aulosira sp. DedQUE10]
MSQRSDSAQRPTLRERLCPYRYANTNALAPLQKLLGKCVNAQQLVVRTSLFSLQQQKCDR